MRKQKGFTLVELLVVVAIIGMLAAIVLVSLGPARQRARDARRQADIRQVSTALELCYDDTTCAGGQRYPTAAADVLGTALGTRLDKYITIPTDPTSTQSYRWLDNTPTGSEYCIYASLEAPASSYFCASERGTATITSTGAPTLSSCCGL